MKNTKTIFKFYTLFEYEEEEAFLENQHKNGWKVVSFKIPGFYKFKKCEQEDVTYRIDFTNENGAKNAEYRQMFADNGWEFLWSVNGFSIFRKPLAVNSEDKSNEIFSDNASRLHMLQNIHQFRLQYRIHQHHKHKECRNHGCGKSVQKHRPKATELYFPNAECY